MCTRWDSFSPGVHTLGVLRPWCACVGIRAPMVCLFALRTGVLVHCGRPIVPRCIPRWWILVEQRHRAPLRPVPSIRSSMIDRREQRHRSPLRPADSLSMVDPGGSRWSNAIELRADSLSMHSSMVDPGGATPSLSAAAGPLDAFLDDRREQRHRAPLPLLSIKERGF